MMTKNSMIQIQTQKINRGCNYCSLPTPNTLICIYMHTCTTHTHTHTHTHMYTHTHTHTCTHTLTCRQPPPHTHTYTHSHTHIHIHIEIASCTWLSHSSKVCAHYYDHLNYHWLCFGNSVASVLDTSTPQPLCFCRRSVNQVFPFLTE